MLRKILLLICIAFVVVCYGYPCLILPFGEYTGKYENPLTGEVEEVSMEFKFGGKVVSGDEESYYKLDGNAIIISGDETFDENDMKIKLTNAYEFEVPVLASSMKYKNNIGMYASIGMGVLAVVLVLTAPSKKN